MSGLGILATALAGGAGVIAKQAGDDVEAQRKSDLMRQQADIEEQMRMRLADFSERLRQQGVLADNTGPLADAKLAMKGREAEVTNKADVDKAGMLATLNDDITKRRAGDKAYLSSVAAIKLADPEVRAHLNQMAAAAGASAAQTRMLGEQLKQLQQVGAVAEQVRGLQSKLAGAKTDDERTTIQQQITDLGFSGKDTKGFMAIAEKAMNNGDAALKVLNDPTASPEAKQAAMGQLSRANEFADKAAAQAGLKLGGAGGKSPYPDGTELKGKDGQMYVVRDGQPVLKSAAGGGKASAAKPEAAPEKLDMQGITFAGDGYKVNGQTYPTLSEAQAARDKAKLGNNPMSRMLYSFGDD